MTMDTSIRDAELVRQAELAMAKGVTGIKIEFEAALFASEESREYVCGDWDIEACENFLMAELVQHKLATERVIIDEVKEYKIKKPLVYSEVYDDQSVDTEWTVSLGLSKAKDILLLPKLCEAWKALLDAVEQDTGVEADLQHAGMHMALLFGKDAYYSSDATQSEKEVKRYTNFKRSMSMLLPALFFLGATESDTRELYFRMPQCARQVYRDHRDSSSMARYNSVSKFSAIHFVGNALEFRVFDPCYDNPEQLLDNFVVMRNCLRFWRDAYMDPHLEKFAKSLPFGPNSRESNALKDFYTTAKHLDVLNAGIRKLKPKYRTITELKQQRGFDLTQQSFIQRRKQWVEEAHAAYDTYSRERAWRERAVYYKHLYYKTEDRITSGVEFSDNLMAELHKMAEADAKLDLDSKKSLAKFVEDFVEKCERRLDQGVAILEAN
jgi:hypothetical protein